jgi:hypothetical protein
MSRTEERLQWLIEFGFALRQTADGGWMVYDATFSKEGEASPDIFANTRAEAIDTAYVLFFDEPRLDFVSDLNRVS